ncbi:MAG: methyltransferase [Patescibacteria group bacterium]
MADDISQLKQDIIFTANLRGHEFTFHSAYGLFSPKEIDRGSLLLIETVAVNPHDTILDVGCGYGAIGLTLAMLAPQGRVHMVDKDFVAVEYAKQNAALNGIANCEIYLSNAFSAVPDIKFDTIVSNLPAKAGNEFFTILFHDAKAHLKPGGKLYVVTLAGMKKYIKRNFQELFGNYKKLRQGKTHAVSLAIRE